MPPNAPRATAERTKISSSGKSDTEAEVEEDEGEEEKEEEEEEKLAAEAMPVCCEGVEKEVPRGRGKEDLWEGVVCVEEERRREEEEAEGERKVSEGASWERGVVWIWMVWEEEEDDDEEEELSSV